LYCVFLDPIVSFPVSRPQEVTEEEDAVGTGQFLSIMNIKQLMSTVTILKTIEIIGLRYRPTR
jgi:hypothetical protein